MATNITETLKNVFVTAATALADKTMATGITGTRVPKLDFRYKDSEANKERLFTALIQRGNTLSGAAKLAREKPGRVVQIRDNDEGVLVGFVDVDTKIFNAETGASPEIVEFEDIQKAVNGTQEPGRNEMEDRRAA